MSQDDDSLDLLDELDDFELVDDGEVVSVRTHHAQKTIWVDDENFGKVLWEGDGRCRNGRRRAGDD